MGGSVSAKRHKHTFTGLWVHFGPYGPQDIHYHPCWDQECDRVLIGQGRECVADHDHRRETLPLTQKARSAP